MSTPDFRHDKQQICPPHTWQGAIGHDYDVTSRQQCLTNVQPPCKARGQPQALRLLIVCLLSLTLHDMDVHVCTGLNVCKTGRKVPNPPYRRPKAGGGLGGVFMHLALLT